MPATYDFSVCNVLEISYTVRFFNIFLSKTGKHVVSVQDFTDNLGYMPLEIAFQTRELRATCESQTRAKRELGELGSKALQRVLADMKAAETVAELFDVGLEIEYCTQEHGMLRFQLDGGLSLFCNVNQQSAPMNGETIDWAQVSRLKVAHIGGGK